MNRAEIESDLKRQLRDTHHHEDARLLLRVLPLADTRSQWTALATPCEGQRYGKMSYEVRREFHPTPLLRKLIALKETL